MSALTAFDPSAVQFLRPWWLLALPLPPALAWAWRRRRDRAAEAWRANVDRHLLPALLDDGGDRRMPSWPWRGILAALLAILAAAGPSWRAVEQPAWQPRAPLVIALDLSSAVLAADLPPSRLAQARAKLAELLKRRQGGQVGLVVYARDAYTVAPLTDDVANVALFLDALDPQVMPGDGHDAARAIAWSARLLRQAGFDRGHILLLTAAADADAAAAAARAARQGYRVSALGLVGGGHAAQARSDPDSLRALARRGGGRYAALTATAADLHRLGVLDPADAQTAGGGRRHETALPQDDGHWLLPLVLLLAAPTFRRGGALGAALLWVWLPLSPLPAQAVESGWWRRADQRDHAHLRQAEGAYRRGDYTAAARGYARVHSADAAYNQGNALARAGRYPEAIAAYDRALQLQPGMADALANRDIVAQRMARGQQQNGQNRQNGGRSRGGPSSSPGQAASPSAKTGGPPDAAAKKQPHPVTGEAQADTGSSVGRQRQAGLPSRSADLRSADAAERQRAADLAQRQRMQRALAEDSPPNAKRDPGAQAVADVDAADRRAARERDILNQAQLQRVPDDPGALLRAKFLLEAQRRRQQGEAP